MPAVRIEDRHRVTEFDGTLIAEVTTRRRRSIRWVTLRLYRLESGSLVLHRIGESLVYHTSPTTCVTESGQPRGDEATAGTLPSEAVPCDRCQPPSWPQELDAGMPVRREFPRHTIDSCADPGEVVKRLTTLRHSQGTSSTVVSAPAAELLHRAGLADPEFASAAKPVERII